MIVLLIAYNSRKSSYFSQSLKLVLFSKAKCLREIGISFAGYSIKQHDRVVNLGCEHKSKLSGEALASKILRKEDYYAMR